MACQSATLRAFLIAAAAAGGADAHGMMTKPVSRQFKYNDIGPMINPNADSVYPVSGVDLAPYNPMNLNAAHGGGADGWAVEKQYGGSLCGDASKSLVDAKRASGESTRPEDGGAFDDEGDYGLKVPLTVNSLKYVEGGDIEIEIVITAHHWGWFEFRLCDRKNHPVMNQECLNEHVLRFDIMEMQHAAYPPMRSEWSESPRDVTDYTGMSFSNRCSGPEVHTRFSWNGTVCTTCFPKGTCCDVSGGYEQRYEDRNPDQWWEPVGPSRDCGDPNTNNQRFVLPSQGNGGGDTIYTMKYKLPKGVSCSEASGTPCTLQWMYITGNSPDNYPEYFKNCADIWIEPSGPGPAPTPTPPVPTPTPTTSPVTTPTVAPTPPPTDSPVTTPTVAPTVAPSDVPTAPTPTPPVPDACSACVPPNNCLFSNGVCYHTGTKPECMQWDTNIWCGESVPTPPGTPTPPPTASPTIAPTNGGGGGECVANPAYPNNPAIQGGVDECNKCGAPTYYEWWPCNQAELCTGDCSRPSLTQVRVQPHKPEVKPSRVRNKRLRASRRAAEAVESDETAYLQHIDSGEELEAEEEEEESEDEFGQSFGEEL